jgi:hypothetical protein
MTPAELLELQDQFKLEHPDADDEMFEAWLSFQEDKGETDESTIPNSPLPPTA